MATHRQAIVAAHCNEADLSNTLKECAQKDPTLLKCVSADEKNTCTCLHESATVRSCLGDCFAAVERGLCKDTTPAFAPGSLFVWFLIL